MPERSPNLHSSRQRRGFTLIELLIALALVSLITLMLFSGLRLGSRAWDGVDAVSERVSEVRLVRDFLMSTLSQSHGATLMLEAQLLVVFAGDRQRLEFSAPLAEQVGVPGLYILRLEVVPSERDQALVLTRWLMHPDVLEGLDTAPAWEPLTEETDLFSSSPTQDLDLAGGAYGQTILLDPVSDFEIAYFGLADGEAEPAWREEWLGQSSQPIAVRIRLATPAQAWPDLVVQLPTRLF